MARRGVIYALAPSHQNLQTIWAGTDDGLIHLTRDGGKNWKDVTPPQLHAWAKVSQLDSSHFDDDTVYAAINTLRLDDLKPHVLRTHDGGKSWQEIVHRSDSGEKHIADVKTDHGWVIEFQHSYLNPEERRSRADRAARSETRIGERAQPASHTDGSSAGPHLHRATSRFGG
jgi:hypothetical protein